MSKATIEKAKETILEMFQYRGYTDLNQTDNSFTAIKPNGSLIHVFINLIQKLNVAEIQSHIAILQELEVNHGILIYKGTPTPTVKNVISNAPALNLIIEIFQIDDLQYNPLNNNLVPAHILLSNEEKNKLKKSFDIKTLPIIKTDDAISLFCGFRKGDIIKIVRKTGIVYRIVR